MIAALLLALQTSTAAPVDPAPLEAGRWVFRETRELSRGTPAVSATILSADRAARLLVRCELGYERDVSLQFLPNTARDSLLTVPAELSLGDALVPFPLTWEQGPIGIFARNGEDDPSASETAASIAAADGRLRMVASSREGPVTAEFDSRLGRDQVRRVIDACAAPAEAAAS